MPRDAGRGEGSGSRWEARAGELELVSAGRGGSPAHRCGAVRTHWLDASVEYWIVLHMHMDKATDVPVQTTEPAATLPRCGCRDSETAVPVGPGR
jgi:hypothetical protein